MYCKKCGRKIMQDEKFCVNCGTVVNAEKITQSNCSYNSQNPRNTNQSSSTANHNNAPYIIGVILLIAGILGVLIAGATIAGDISDYNNAWGYSYKGHLTSHETQMITILMFSIIGGITGLIMTIANHKK